MLGVDSDPSTGLPQAVHARTSPPPAWPVFPNHTTSTHSTLPPFTKYVDDTTAFYFKVLFIVSGCSVVGTLGVVTNIINIIVFVRQGVFSESNVACLFCLAISDLLSVGTVVWLSISLGIALSDVPNLNWKPYDIMYLTAGWPHLLFAQITRMITAYVAFERCMCVVFPFKVRTWFKPKRSFYINCFLFLFCILSYSPMFVTHQLRFQTDPETNRSKLALYFTKERYWAMSVIFYINSLVNIGSVGLVLLCTTVTISRVQLSKAWRQTVSSQPAPAPDADQGHGTGPSQKEKQQQNVPNVGKERRLVRMVTTISTIFLFCYMPDFVFFIMYLVNPDIRTFGPYDNLAVVMYSIVCFMESINSTINIFVYYKMSSRYKQEFDHSIFKKNLKPSIT